MQYNAKYKNVGYKIVCVYFYLEKLYSIYLYYILMKKAMAAHSSTLGLKELDTTQQLPFQFSLSCIGEGNGNPLQCSCLENPRDRGA